MYIIFVDVFVPSGRLNGLRKQKLKETTEENINAKRRIFKEREIRKRDFRKKNRQRSFIRKQCENTDEREMKLNATRSERRKENRK